VKVGRRETRAYREPGTAARRIAVVGNTGSGKTTLARRLAAQLGVPHFELDALFWRPGWEMAPTEQFRAQVTEVMRAEAWVIDGNSFGRLGERVLEQADLVVWLDPPLRTILARLTRRTAERIRSGEEMWGTNRETIRGAFLSRNSLFVWAMRMHFQKRAERGEVIARFPHVRLRSTREAEEWLRGRRAGVPT
jgi:adenylate kinase family enzyme